MKRILTILVILVSCISCADLFLGADPENNNVAIFDSFWRAVDQTWPAFESKHVNWDSLYRVYKPKVIATSNDKNLSDVLTDLVANLKDSHTDIYPKGLPVIQFYPAQAPNFYGFQWITRAYAISYNGNKSIGYGLLTSDIGYIYIGSFNNASTDYLLIDNILRDFQETKAIIIDVRSNTGGSSTNSEIIASRFADDAHVYAYAKFRMDDHGKALTDFISEAISPSGQYHFGRRVAILTNRYSYSATEDFVLMMKSFPQVIHLGAATGGGSETRPIFKELPAGWYCRIATKLLCDVNKQPISSGIPPDIAAETTKADSLKGKDTIIERALEELSK